MNRSKSVMAKGIIPGIVSAVGWSMTGIFVKLLPEFSSWALVSLRSFVALAATVAFLIFSKKVNFSQVFKSIANWWFALLMVGYYVTAVAAYQLTTVAEVALLLNTSPVFALMIKVYRGGKIGRLEGIGTLVALIGLSVILLPDVLSNSNLNYYRFLGGLLALSSSYLITVYATQMELFKSRGNKADLSSITILTYLVGGVLLFAVSSIFDSESMMSTAYSVKEILLIIGLGLISTVIPSVAYSVAASKISAVQLTTLRLLIPILASLFAYLFLSELPAIWVLPGGVLVLVGIIILIKQKRDD